MEEVREFRYFGPPGCGKTYNLTQLAHKTVEKYGSDSLLIASFTKTAAAEIAGRGLPIPKEQIGTLHAHCYRALGRPPVAEKMLEEWNTYAPEYSLSGEGKANVDEDVTEQHFGSTGDLLFNQYGLMRNKLTPRDVWPQSLRAFAAKFEDWKQATGCLDFTDMIERAYLDVDTAPGNPKIAMIDEVQDCVPLELQLVRSWGKNLETLVLSGDDDQCQPTGSKVLTTVGYIPIELLDPQVHRVVSYDRPASSVTGIRNGYSFRKAQRAYDGRILSITAGERTAKCTPEHRWIAKWTEEAKDSAHVVYLMRQGERFRVGWCKLFRADGIFHLGHRARVEEADEAWILKLTHDKTDASKWESFIAARYGLPLIMFEPTEATKHYTRDTIDFVFDGLRDVMRNRAEKCLREFGVDIKYPIWSKIKVMERRGGNSIIEVEACNMIPRLMTIPVHTEGTKVEWMPITVENEEYTGIVYSLDVEKHHLYITEGLVTHNCIYHFKGASPKSFLFPPVPDSQKRVLSQSYRVPRAVQAVAQRLIEKVSIREPKVYNPRDEEGEVRLLQQATWRNPEAAVLDAERYLADGKSVMFLTTCSFMLEPLKQVLKKSGIPFHNPFRKSRGDWNPLTPERGTSSAQRLLAYLRPDNATWGSDARMWTPDDMARWIELIKAKGILKKGAKGRLETMDGSGELDIATLLDFFEEDALMQAMECNLDWLESNLLSAKQKAMEFPLMVARTRGAGTLRETPKVLLGTGHSVKGGEADVCYVFPDLSMAGQREFLGSREAKDSIIRLFYVMTTRAKESLILCGAGTPYHVKLGGLLNG